jgi:non-homologous end joining protein Ku
VGEAVRVISPTFEPIASTHRKRERLSARHHEDFDSVKVESSSVMTIEKFVETDSIDPVYYDAAYYLAPMEMPASTFMRCSAKP